MYTVLAVGLNIDDIQKSSKYIKMNDEILLVGSGGHAKSCVDVIEVKGDYKIAGFIEKNNLKKQESLRLSDNWIR